MKSGRIGWVVAGFVMLAVGIAPRSAAAQGGDGFLFRAPRLQLGVRVGYAALLGPRSAGSTTDLYGFTQDLLTIDDGDWDATGLAGELGVRLSDRFDLMVDFGQNRSEVTSEFRDWVDQDDLPIVQTTSFTRRPLNFSLRYFVVDRGRRIGRFAWIPRSFVPFVGAGVGSVWYDLEQEGEFIDFQTLEIFGDRLSSSGRANTAHLSAGFQYAVGKYGVLTAEGLYRFGSGGLGGDFVGFDDLDLSGLQFGIGLGVRF